MGEKRSDQFASYKDARPSQKSGPFGKVSRKSDKRFSGYREKQIGADLHM